MKLKLYVTLALATLTSLSVANAAVVDFDGNVCESESAIRTLKKTGLWLVFDSVYALSDTNRVRDLYTSAGLSRRFFKGKFDSGSGVMNVESEIRRDFLPSKSVITRVHGADYAIEISDRENLSNLKIHAKHQYTPLKDGRKEIVRVTAAPVEPEDIARFAAHFIPMIQESAREIALPGRVWFSSLGLVCEKGQIQDTADCQTRVELFYADESFSCGGF